MYKNIALIALLLPFSGYAITKQERIREIEKISYALNQQAIKEWIEFLFNLPCSQLSISALPEEKVIAFKALQKEIHDKLAALEKESKELE
jgi:hypothetical protein